MCRKPLKDGPRVTISLREKDDDGSYRRSRNITCYAYLPDVTRALEALLRSRRYRDWFPPPWSQATGERSETVATIWGELPVANEAPAPATNERTTAPAKISRKSHSNKRSSNEIQLKGGHHE